VPDGGVNVLGDEPPCAFDGAYEDVVDTYTGPESGPSSSGPIDGIDEKDDDVDEDAAAGGAGPPSPEPLGKPVKSLACRRTGTKYLLCCWCWRWGVGAASPSIRSGALSSARDAAHNVVGLRIVQLRS
jgi:hypothetical protein